MDDFVKTALFIFEIQSILAKTIDPLNLQLNFSRKYGHQRYTKKAGCPQLYYRDGLEVWRFHDQLKGDLERPESCPV